MTRWVFPCFAFVIALMALGCQPKIDDNTAAWVNGRAISMEELAGFSDDSHDQSEQTREQTEALKQQLLEQLIEEELIVQDAERKGITVSDDELKQQIDEIRNDFPGQTFEDMLVREYIDYDAWREKTRRSLLVEKTTLSELSARITMDPKELEMAFRERLAMGAKPRRFLVRHMTTTSQELAEKARNRFESGEDFKVVADDLAGPARDKERAGKYWIYLDRLPQAMAQAIAVTPVGQISEIVESEFGFTIFQVLEIERFEDSDPKTVLADVKRLYWERRRAEVYDLWMEELKQKAEIAINPILAKAAETNIKSDQTR